MQLSTIENIVFITEKEKSYASTTNYKYTLISLSRIEIVIATLFIITNENWFDAQNFIHRQQNSWFIIILQFDSFNEILWIHLTEFNWTKNRYKWKWNLENEKRRNKNKKKNVTAELMNMTTVNDAPKLLKWLTAVLIWMGILNSAACCVLCYS